MEVTLASQVAGEKCGYGTGPLVGATNKNNLRTLVPNPCIFAIRDSDHRRISTGVSSIVSPSIHDRIIDCAGWAGDRRCLFRSTPLLAVFPDAAINGRRQAMESNRRWDRPVQASVPVAMAAIFLTEALGYNWGVDVLYVPTVALAVIGFSRVGVVLVGLLSIVLAAGAYFISDVTVSGHTGSAQLAILLLAIALVTAVSAKVKGLIPAVPTGLSDSLSIDDFPDFTGTDVNHLMRLTTVADIGASIAHEMRQPISAIQIHSHAGLRWLNRKRPDHLRARESLIQILKNAERAGELIDRFDALASNRPVARVDQDLNELVKDTLSLLEFQLAQKNIKVDLALESTAALVVGDRVQLQHVLINLLVNSVQSMSMVRDRPHTLTIRSWRTIEGTRTPCIALEIRDTGTGIHVETAAGLFCDVHSTKPEAKGLSLLICRSIIEAHGGRILATPTNGPGASFTFSVPLSSAGAPGELRPMMAV
ncbi:ATP-binding protein (plasmid) [Rhizobium sp. CC1099]|uniref:sensor histidine kinase n=1 Tax=Rhizobium sp. CC1099 TaxID=3039160 RepID=UPI0024B1A3EF|nr:ATP-binding protein [Rhizobium sp. CC1099]WFU91405.1 ATP-binding protein [Rhizobium sp. CC1099]